MREEPLRAILFDAGNTLVFVDPARMVEIFRAEGADTDAEGFRAAERQARRRLHECIGEGQKGTEPEVWREYFEALLELGGVRPEKRRAVGARIREAHAADHLWTHVEPGTAETLVLLAETGYRLGVISNADGRIEALLERCGLRDHFEFVIDSEVVGVEKPDPAIFMAGCEALDVPAAQCLYIGDLYPVDYVGATSAGLEAVLLDPFGFHEGRAPRVGALDELPLFVASMSSV